MGEALGDPDEIVDASGGTPEPAVAVLLDEFAPGVLAGLRRRVRELLTGLDIEAVDDAVLVANELATNALVHGGLPGETRLASTSDGWVRLEVDDLSPTRPHPVSRSPQCGGMGMHLVDQVAISWGCTSRPGSGKTVWAELHLPQPDPPAPAGSSRPTGIP